MKPFVSKQFHVARDLKWEILNLTHTERLCCWCDSQHHVTLIYLNSINFLIEQCTITFIRRRFSRRVVTREWTADGQTWRLRQNVLCFCSSLCIWAVLRRRHKENSISIPVSLHFILFPLLAVAVAAAVMCESCNIQSFFNCVSKL